ncbi:AraC-like DNA-binding protein [Dyadobacter jejuensis]|uniref:AraC-like DNA-binding protein n=1 Tax=Dyadobacter jejuensis TaxID=1082580 RepID=A0A316AKT1_9BACT|nr:AraC family transcriptional regulator [Dyadobacter jejuensis]PWJ57978.1 AraC-like DNA-binding protein [Dyadobacter jejuensis]
MKAQLLKISNKIEQSFSIRHDIIPVYHNRWHYHPEIEIVHIRKGKGTYIIGDSISSFEEDDLFVLGANLPHLFRYDHHNEEILSDAYVIHFLPNFLSEEFFKVPEMKVVREFIAKAQQGIHIKQESSDKFGGIMSDLHDSSGVFRLINLLKVFAELCNAKSETKLASFGYFNNYDAVDSERLNNIYHYVLGNFEKEITLQEISNVANLSVNSFCRYFKTKTNKTFSNFLLEVRVGHACKLLIETDLNISQICFESGFNNLSNFNRYFKKIAGKTPSQYVYDAK